MQVATTYDVAISRKYPEQVDILIVKDASGKYNPITLGWTMLTSHEPPMMAIAIGKTRYTLEAIRASKAFVIAMLSSTMAEEAMFHGTHSGKDMDKIEKFGTATQPATKIDCRVLSDAVANFECRLVSEHETGDHIIFVGEVIASHVNEDKSVRRLYSLGNEKLGGVHPD